MTPHSEFERQVTDSLARIEEKVKMLPDHERRLRWLERLAYGLIGAWTLLVGWFSHHAWGGHR